MDTIEAIAIAMSLIQRLDFKLKVEKLWLGDKN
jgi:hypothetical protein